MHDDGIDEQLIRRDSDHTSGAAVYMLPTTQQHPVELSAMADAEANLHHGHLDPPVGVDRHIRGPARCSSRRGAARRLRGPVARVRDLRRPPEVRHESPAPDRRSSSLDLLFFGHLSSMPVDEYVEEIRRVAGDYDEIMAATARDIHGIGSCLRRHEYRYLRLAYLCFLAGLVSGGAVELAGLIL